MLPLGGAHWGGAAGGDKENSVLVTYVCSNSVQRCEQVGAGDRRSGVGQRCGLTVWPPWRPSSCGTGEGIRRGIRRHATH